MPEQPQPTPPPPATPPPRHEHDAGHIPITEEMDSAKWTLPPIVPVLIALGAVALIVALVSFVNRPTPAASGEITDVQAVEMTGAKGDRTTLVAINVKVQNATDRRLILKTASAEVTLPDKPEPLKDEAAAAVDFERYYAGFPALQQNAIDALKPEARIAAETDAAGRIIVMFPIPKEQFDARKALAVRLDLYDQRPVIITKSY
jgi:hypothetical protein